MTKKQKQAKVSRVMKEFKAGTLKSSSGDPIKNYKQAVAIALSEAGMSMPKKDASEEDIEKRLRERLAKFLTPSDVTDVTEVSEPALFDEVVAVVAHPDA